MVLSALRVLVVSSWILVFGIWSLDFNNFLLDLKLNLILFADDLG